MRLPTFDFRERQDGVCVFYGRDRGEKDQNATDIKLEDLAQDPWIEYTYVYGLDNKWRYFEDNKYSGKDSLIDVGEDLERHFKSMGIDRPKGLYGYFDERAIRAIRNKQEEESAKRNSRDRGKEKDKDDKIKD